MAKNKSSSGATLGHLYFGTFVVALGVFAYALTFGFAARARILPQPVCILLVVMGLIEVWNARMHFKYLGKNLREKKKNLGWYQFLSNPVYSTIIVIIIYPLLLKLAGFIVASTIAIATLMFVRGIRSKKTVAIFSIITPLTVYFLFNLIGGTKFPQGPWGF